MIRPGDENWVWCTLQTCENVCPKVVDGADEVFIPHQQVGHEHSKNDGTDPGANEPFNSLLRRELYQLCAAKGDAADIGKDVVRDDKTNRQEKPNHALEDVVHDEVRHYHYKE